jgi:hypothetical protein
MLGLALTGWGCQQPPSYFYNGSGAPACVPVVPAPAVPVNGKPGGPPTEVIEGGMTSAADPGRTTTVIGSEAPPRVVVSETDSRPRTTWLPNPNADPVVATTSVEGAINRTTSGSSTANP